MLVVAITIGREGHVVKQGERLPQQRRQIGRVEPGRQVVQEALQRVLARLAVGQSSVRWSSAATNRTTSAWMGPDPRP